METIKVIVTGATGMVGEGVLHQCLNNDSVSQVLIINRRPSGMAHPKLQEIVHGDFHNLSPIAGQLAGYDACFFCLGVSSVGMNEADYTRLTYDLTMHMAGTLAPLNPGLTFCYVSGAGTDSSKQGRLMWARVKGKTENDLSKLPLRAVYNFRPGIIAPGKGLKNTLSMYKYLGWLLGIIKAVAPWSVTTLAQLGNAMINAATKGYAKPVLEVADIHKLAAG